MNATRIALPALALLLLAACARPPEYVKPVTALPEDQRGDIAVAFVEIDFTGPVVNDDLLTAEIRRAVTDYVGRCNPDGGTPRDFHVLVTMYDRGSGGTAYVGGDSSTLDATLDIRPRNEQTALASYDLSVSVSGFGVPGSIVIGNSEKYLANRMGAYVCTEILGREDPGEPQG